MTSRLLARLLTGPLAFALAGALDLSQAWARWALARGRERMRERARGRARLPSRGR